MPVKYQASSRAFANWKTNASFFFARPTTIPERHALKGGRQSVLYLLRREAQDCLIGAVVPESMVLQRQERYRLFATMMVVLAGIDLLGKFYFGDDSNGGVHDRFVGFAHSCLWLSDADAERLYAVRNSLMHSFGLYDKKTGHKIVAAQDCGVSDKNTSPVQEEGNVWSVCIEHLYISFLQGLRRYRKALNSAQDLQHNFSKMFNNYGYLRVS